VTATDSAGRVGRDTCRIIIVPNQDNRNINDARKLKKGGKRNRGDGNNYVGKNGKSGKSETKRGKSGKSNRGDEGGDNNVGKNGNSCKGGKSGKSNRCNDDDDFPEYIGNVTDASLELYEITSLVLLWENNLDPPEQD